MGELGHDQVSEWLPWDYAESMPLRESCSALEPRGTVRALGREGLELLEHACTWLFLAEGVIPSPRIPVRGGTSCCDCAQARRAPAEQFEKTIVVLHGFPRYALIEVVKS